MAQFNQWKVIEEAERFGEERFRIYSVPKHEPGLDSAPRLVAKLERKADADLIVRLYEAHRNAQVNA